MTKLTTVLLTISIYLLISVSFAQASTQVKVDPKVTENGSSNTSNQRAQSSCRLQPELSRFVTQKINQLSSNS